MFASKTPRDLNHDPYGYICVEGPSCRHSRKLAPTTRWEPRPKFDHVQHNAPNPILVEFRRVHRAAHLAPHPVGWLAGHWLLNWRNHEDTWVEEVGDDVIDHARRVLTRLAQIGASA